jgi:hypothetical protein
MTAQQRDMAEQILRDAPFDLGRDVAVRRPLLEQTLTSQPPPPEFTRRPATWVASP